MITSRLTSKAQTTILQPVRVALHLHEGDEIANVIEARRVVLTDDSLSTFLEWDSSADVEAYAAL
ncbi:transcriptional regulator (plasmid) [Lichenicola cladoniae]|uniref:Transcriptional regulator n=1 Tax=Lichenicola cladoniae TaxID=1484109 RepID=A0A6M8I1J3_9PROT|nr:transcriptional regulator [Lichenicola cladoniae]NPD69660.1 transcriptional regulator [Acetobacteraceae bacterium]QKE93965.1 transcriptional regulator [Lichenicola cladoniae]